MESHCDSIPAKLLASRDWSSSATAEHALARGIGRPGGEEIEDREIRHKLPVRHVDRYATTPRIAHDAIFEALVTHCYEHRCGSIEIGTRSGAVPMIHREVICEAACGRIDPVRDENHVVAADHREPQQIQRPRGTSDHHDTVVAGR
ncbi:MAG TPA: hypothetical protein VH414_21015 [Lichenihabitans sp.]|jgi:hypothetical protein|nr:hypothetical protein [Lichenihabitans sp.]